MEEKTIKDVFEATTTIIFYLWQKAKKLYFWFEKKYMGEDENGGKERIN